MRVALIGNGTQSRRIQKILKSKNINYVVFDSKFKLLKTNQKRELINEFDIFFILTPHNQHFEYLNIIPSNKYIFCEKPPVNKIKDLIIFKKINPGKIYFNFNFRFSKLNRFLKEKQKYKLGKLLNININISHGLSKKKKYKKNWRSNFQKCPKGIFEIVLIHYIDLINEHYKIKKVLDIKLLNTSGYGNSFDTCNCNLQLQNKSYANLFASYNGPLLKRVLFVFENGIIQQDENKIEILGPANNFNKKGFFIKPKIIKKINLSENNDYNSSLEESINFFLRTIKKKRKFSKELYNNAIEVNKILLNKNY